MTVRMALVGLMRGAGHTPVVEVTLASARAGLSIRCVLAASLVVGYISSDGWGAK